MKFISVIKKTFLFRFCPHNSIDAINMYIALFSRYKYTNKKNYSKSIWLQLLELLFELISKRKFFSLGKLKATRRTNRRNKITFIFKPASLSVEWKAMRRGRERGKNLSNPSFLFSSEYDACL